MRWDTIIGLEVHAQLSTQSKLFSAASSAFGAAPNTQTSFIDAGLPGVLPVLNQQAVLMAIQFGLAVNAQINNLSYFERKNYFYPDLPKGYQISQYLRPIVAHGQLSIELPSGQSKQVTIERAHLEEDAGKSTHDAHHDYSGIDLNRAGNPLLEIVTSPCLFSAEEAVSYLKALHQLVRFLGICDGNMQEGSFRCDVNISLKPAGSDTLGTRTELKNLNSFRFIEKAIAYEQARQQELLEHGLRVVQETRQFCPDTETTQTLRSKENEQDYRYFPDPDLLPIFIDEQQLADLRATLPPLPHQIRQQLNQSGKLSPEDISFLLASPVTYRFFEEVCRQTTADKKLVINWLRGHYAAALNDMNSSFENPVITASELAKLLTLLQQKTLTNNAARQAFSLLWNKEGNFDEIVATLAQPTTDYTELESFIKTLITNNPQQVNEFRAGKEKILGFFVGQVMKFSKGSADPEVVNRLLRQYLA